MILPGNDVISYGGATFARALVRERLVDEYRLVIQPAALGDGLPLFTELTEPLYLNLVESRSYPAGAAIHVYRTRGMIETLAFRRGGGIRTLETPNNA